MSRRKKWLKIQKAHNANLSNHHIFFCRKRWQQSQVNNLRNYWYCIVPIDNDLHQALHDSCGEVPIPRKISSDEALDQLEFLNRYGVIHLDDPIEKRLGLLIFLFEYVEPEVVEALEQQFRIVGRFKPS